MPLQDSDYIRISHFFARMKFLHGNDFVNATLRRHSELKKALIEYESKHILELEREILNSDKE